jgi:hypothetical protein
MLSLAGTADVISCWSSHHLVGIEPLAEELIQLSRFVRALDPVDDLLPISDTSVGRLVCPRDERPPNTTVPPDAE